MNLGIGLAGFYLYPFHDSSDDAGTCHASERNAVNTSLISKILLATDFSDSAVLAQVYAEYLAVALKASMVILHVNEHPSDARTPFKKEKDIEATLRTLQDNMKARAVPVSIRHSRGIPGDEIPTTARELGVDLIVMGSQGHTHVPYGLLGVTAQAVTANGPCPVVTVPLPCKPSSPCKFTMPEAVQVGRIFAPVDFSGPSLDSLECAIHLAHGLRAALVLAHVVEPAHADWDLHRMEDAAHVRDEWEVRLGDLTGVMKSLGLSTTCEIRTGLPADSILAGALQHRCDLIVMGTHGRRGREGRHVGSVAETVLKQATCPIVTVKNPKFVPGGRLAIRTVLSQRHDHEASEDACKASDRTP